MRGLILKKSKMEIKLIRVEKEKELNLELCNPSSEMRIEYCAYYGRNGCGRTCFYANQREGELKFENPVCLSWEDEILRE